jgi:hypothetical protein
VVANNLKLRRRPRFISKDPGDSLRVSILDEIFPEALFVHIIRDGRAVVQSTVRNLRQRGEWYGIKIPGWQALVDRPLVETAGMQWRVTVESARRGSEARAGPLPRDPLRGLRRVVGDRRPDEGARLRPCGVTAREARLAAESDLRRSPR